jgi:hypothetical protein
MVNLSIFDRFSILWNRFGPIFQFLGGGSKNSEKTARLTFFIPENPAPFSKKLPLEFARKHVFFWTHFYA